MGIYNEKSGILGIKSEESIAEEFKNRMNLSVNACDDFYQYSCGGWMDKVKLDDSLTIIDSFEIIENEIERKLIEDLSMAKSELDNVEVYKKARDMFKSCMKPEHAEGCDGRTCDGTETKRKTKNKNARWDERWKVLCRVKRREPGPQHMENAETKNLNRLKEILKTFGGFPALQKTPKTETYENFVEELRKLGASYSGIFVLDIEVDSSNSSRNVLAINDGFSLMPTRKAYIDKGKLFNAYSNLFVKVAMLLKEKHVTRKEIEYEVNAVMAFETEMEKALYESRTDYWDLSKIYNKMNLTNLQSLAPAINWKSHLNALTGQNILEDEMIINIQNPQYVKKMANLIQNTPLRTVVTYMLWKFVFYNLEKIGPELINPYKIYAEIAYGEKSSLPKDKICFSNVVPDYDTSCMVPAVSSIYIKNYFPEHYKKLISEMVSTYRSTYKDILKRQSWMDKSTKNEALNKVDGMRSFTYPKELKNITILNQLCSKVKVGDNFLSNLLAVQKDKEDRKFSKFRMSPETDIWINNADAKAVNGFYSPSFNFIGKFLTAGILQDVFFQKTRPMSMNYGGIGWLIGHEISHGFDVFGRQFDTNGTHSEWWSNETLSRYNKKVDCFKEEFGKYNYPLLGDTKLNTNITIGEILGDAVGILSSYEAFNVKSKGMSKSVPKTFGNFTDRQLFWIAYAQGHCTKANKRGLELSQQESAHPPAQIRINGVLKHSKQFQLDFNCRSSDEMNAKKKCALLI
ncbi:Neprilysin-1 [Nymphon striatum]|nr:Neprilysin-1 [Nymphon striatum]